MSWAGRRWDTEAVLERLGAERAVDMLPRADIAERARLRLRLAALAAAVDRGDLPAESATEEFRSVQTAVAGRLDGVPEHRGSVGGASVRGSGTRAGASVRRTGA